MELFLSIKNYFCCPNFHLPTCFCCISSVTTNKNLITLNVKENPWKSFVLSNKKTFNMMMTQHKEKQQLLTFQRTDPQTFQYILIYF